MFTSTVLIPFNGKGFVPNVVYILSLVAHKFILVNFYMSLEIFTFFTVYFKIFIFQVYNPKYEHFLAIFGISESD